MWTNENRGRYERSGLRYPSDLTDEECADGGQVKVTAPFERYIAKDRHNADLRRKASTAIAAKMARTAYAVVKGGEPYRPVFRGDDPRRKDPSLKQPWRRRFQDRRPRR